MKPLDFILKADTTPACADHHDPEMWFTWEGSGWREPVAVCAGCPLVVECARYALDRPYLHGVWGGMTPEQRETVRKKLGHTKDNRVSWFDSSDDWAWAMPGQPTRSAPPVRGVERVCRNGHELTDESSHMDRHGHSVCKTCRRNGRDQENARRRQARREAQAAGMVATFDPPATRCARDHELDWYVYADGRASCRECRREADRESGRHRSDRRRAS